MDKPPPEPHSLHQRRSSGGTSSSVTPLRIAQDTNMTGSAQDGPALTVAAVAQRLGVAPATLRTWDRRYGLGPSGHAAGAHRRYSNDDVARLVVMRRLALDGVAPQDAARAALEADVSQITPEQLDAELKTLAQASRDPKDLELVRSTPAITQQSAAILPFPSTHRDAVTAAAVIEAVQAGRQDECEQLLTIGVDADPMVWWRTIVRPAMQQLAMRTVLARPGEDPAVFLTSAAYRALGRYVTQWDEAVSRRGMSVGHPSQNRRMVLAFLAPNEPDVLATHVFAAEMLRHSVPVRIVTGPVTEHRIVEILTMVRPVVTVLISEYHQPDLEVLRYIHQARSDLPIIAGLKDDEAAQQLPLAPNVQRIRSCESAIHEVLALLDEE